MQILIEPEDNINFPDDLRVYIFDRGDISRFPKPVRNDIDIYSK